MRGGRDAGDAVTTPKTSLVRTPHIPTRRNLRARHVAPRHHCPVHPVGRLWSAGQGLLRHNRAGRRLAPCMRFWPAAAEQGRVETLDACG